MLDRLLGRRKREQPKSESALTADQLRDSIVAEREAEVPRFQQLTKLAPGVYNPRLEADEPWQTFGEAVRDVARAAYDYDEPRVRPRGEMQTSHLFNREVLAQVLNSPEFQEARHYTTGRAEDAMFSAVALGDQLRDAAAECAEHVDRSNEAAETEKALSDAQDMIADLREKAQKLAEQDEALPEPDVQAMKDQIAAREEAKQKLAKLTQEHLTSNAPALAAKIAQRAGKKIEEQAKTAQTLYGLAPGSETTVDPARRIAIAEQFSQNPRLKRILEIAGRLARDMRFKRQSKTKNVQIEPVGITTGRDIGRMLPHELARAYMPELRPVWIKNYSERSLLEYEMSGKDRVAKGDVIVVKDGSSSMSAQNRIEWATGVQLACLSIAQREKRNFAGVEFGAPGECKSWQFPKAKPANPEDVLDMASHFFSGGTSILQGLTAAKEILDAGEPFSTADIVLVTDGQCPFEVADQALVELLRDRGVRIHGISILAPNNAYLKQACDWQLDVADLAGNNEATDRLATELT